MSGNKDPLDVVQLFIDKNKDSFGQIGFGGGRLWLRLFYSIIREALISNSLNILPNICADSRSWLLFYQSWGTALAWPSVELENLLVW